MQALLGGLYSSCFSTFCHQFNSLALCPCYWHKMAPDAKHSYRRKLATENLLWKDANDIFFIYWLSIMAPQHILCLWWNLSGCDQISTLLRKHKVTLLCITAQTTVSLGSLDKTSSASSTDSFTSMCSPQWPHHHTSYPLTCTNSTKSLRDLWQ